MKNLIAVALIAISAGAVAQPLPKMKAADVVASFPTDKGGTVTLTDIPCTDKALQIEGIPYYVVTGKGWLDNVPITRTVAGCYAFDEKDALGQGEGVRIQWTTNPADDDYLEDRIFTWTPFGLKLARGDRARMDALK